MILLEQIRVASPCHADWDEMTGTDQARFCGQCRKNVYNLSEMTRAEADALILEKEGHLCVRFYTRADGTVLTQDCPAGLRAVRVKLARKLSCAAAMLLSCGTGLLRWSGMAQAVTPARPRAKAVSPPASPPVVPERLEGWTAGAPLAVPPTSGTPRRPIMGKFIMGKPTAPAPPPATKAHSHRRRLISVRGIK